MHPEEVLKKVRTAIELTRPLTLLAPLIIGVIAPITFASILGVSASLFLIWQVSSTLVGLNIASNYLNQAVEVDIDRINKPYRPLPRGDADPIMVAVVAGLLYGLISARAYLDFGNAAGSLVFLIIIITVAYSFPKYNLKKVFPLNVLSQALARGVLAPLFVWTAVGGSLEDPQIYFFMSVPFVFLLGMSSVKDFADMKGDEEFGVQTLPLKFGRRKAAGIVAVFVFLAHILWIFLCIAGFLPRSILPVAIILAGLVPYILLTDLMKEKPQPFKKPKLIENSASWVTMYLWLIIYYVSIGIAIGLS